MRFATPDQALRATWETFQQCSTVQAMNPVAQEGTRFAKICAQCKSGPYRVKHDRDGLPFALCRHCGKDRHREDVFLLRESGGGGGDFARPLDRLADLELVVDRCYATGGAFRAYAVVILSPWPMWRVRQVCSENRWGPGEAGVFTERTLRRAIRDGRARLARELHLADMLSTDLVDWIGTSSGYGRRFA